MKLNGEDETMMKVKDLIEILNEYDEDSLVELFVYGESSQREASFEIDIEVDNNIVILSSGAKIQGK